MDVVLEEVARDLLIVMKDNLNLAIDQVWTEMAMEDTVFYAALGTTVPETPKPYPVSFYLGHHPTILEHDVEDYPNITCVAYDHASVNDLGADQYEVVGNRAYVEAFVLHADESTVNRLAWRYAKALHRVIDQYKDLDDRKIEPVTTSPDVQVSNAAARRGQQFTSDIVYIQGCRLEYVFRVPEVW